MNCFHKKDFNGPVCYRKVYGFIYCFVADILVSDFASADALAFTFGFTEEAVCFVAFTSVLAWLSVFASTFLAVSTVAAVFFSTVTVILSAEFSVLSITWLPFTVTVTSAPV